MTEIEYKGNQFILEKVTAYSYKGKEQYRVSFKEITCEHVFLPESYEGVAVTMCTGYASNQIYWDREKFPHFEKARILHIPASIQFIDIHNDIFPELERVDVDLANKYFFTDGRLIIRRDKMELVYCPVCRGESLEIPEYVRRIHDDAFEGTMYTEIRFLGKAPVISSDAFKRSRWLSSQESIMIGDMLYKIPEDDRLEVPDHIRRFDPYVFRRYGSPREMVTPVLPGRLHMEYLTDCHFLKLTSRTAPVNMACLRMWESLEDVDIAEGHKQYRTVDGVIYSRDGRILAWYPCHKRGDTFTVPDGVQKIAEFAFANQAYLKRITMPDSVRALGAGAFSNCRMLEHVDFSPGIREIPDASIYRRHGMFEGCSHLKSIVLPDKMTYLGSFAFQNSGLQSIELGEKLEQIGEYALMAEKLEEIRLPSSVKRVGRGSLFYAKKVTAYEGTARGLVSAVNTHWPGEKESAPNLKWSRCWVEVLHRKSEKRDSFYIPESLKMSAAYHLEYAWNGDHIDYEEYDQCLEKLSDSDEKLEFAQYGLLRKRDGEENIYEDYVRRVSFKLGYRLLEQGREKEFLSLLKRDVISENSLQKLLKYSNERGETVCSAYIADILRKKKGGKKASSSFRI